MTTSERILSKQRRAIAKRWSSLATADRLILMRIAKCQVMPCDIVIEANKDFWELEDEDQERITSYYTTASRLCGVKL